MVPKPDTTERFGDAEFAKESLKGGCSDRLELQYDGYLYDVTSFVNKHPGGKIIEMYLKTKEDSFHAVQQFHFRSIDRVTNIMRSLPKRPIKDAKDYAVRHLTPEQQKRYKEMDKDFMQLFKEAKEEGLFEPSLRHTLIRCVEVYALMLFGLVIFMLFPESTLMKILGASLVALGAGRGGWVLHEGGHNSLTGYPTIDKYLLKFYMGICLGIAGCWWTSQHNRHHAMPNNIRHDVDMKTLPLLAYNKKVVRKPSHKNIFIRFQQYLFPTLDIFLIGIFFKTTSLIKSIGQRQWFEMFCMFVHYFTLYWCYGLHNFHYIALTYFLTTSYFLINFTLSHTHLPVTTEPVHWIEYSLTHTTNVKSGPFKIIDYWMGYLNYQIEHHLFPTMPQFKNQLIRDRVKALAKKYDLQYNLISYPKALYLTFENLGKVSKELYSHKD